MSRRYATLQICSRFISKRQQMPRNDILGTRKTRVCSKRDTWQWEWTSGNVTRRSASHFVGTQHRVEFRRKCVPGNGDCREAQAFPC